MTNKLSIVCFDLPDHPKLIRRASKGQAPKEVMLLNPNHAKD